MNLRAIPLLIAVFIFSSSAGFAIEKSKSTAHKNSVHKNVVHTSKRLFLVPPPPAYVPSFLPELTYSRYYGHYHYSNSQARTQTV